MFAERTGAPRESRFLLAKLISFRYNPLMTDYTVEGSYSSPKSILKTTTTEPL